MSFFKKMRTLFTSGCDLKGIKTGDWVESVYLKGYFKVYQIKPCYREGKDEGCLLLLKKAFTSSMKFSFTTEKCHVAWCEKLTENKVRELERLLEENPSKKKKFEEMPPFFPCLQIFYFLNIPKDRIDSFREKLKELPRYFTKEHFDSFLSQCSPFTPRNGWSIPVNRCFTATRKSEICTEPSPNWMRRSGVIFRRKYIKLKQRLKTNKQKKDKYVR